MSQPAGAGRDRTHPAGVNQPFGAPLSCPPSRELPPLIKTKITPRTPGGGGYLRAEGAQPRAPGWDEVVGTSSALQQPQEPSSHRTPTREHPGPILTGLEAPSAAASLLAASFRLRLFPRTGCRLLSLPPISSSPMSTPLSSLRVCPLSDSWDSVEAGGEGGCQGGGRRRGSASEDRGQGGGEGTAPAARAGRLPGTRIWF